jgi:formate dehydrogenase major subunit
MTIRFTLDGAPVDAAPGETIWQAATRHGAEIPHLCHLERPGYRPDGNCRACLVEVAGERVLAASCIRKPAEGMEVRSANERVRQARRMVFELLLADQPAAASRDASGGFARWARHLDVQHSRFEAEPRAPRPDPSHPAMLVQLDACIQCGLCERACREVQHNDVIGLAHRGMDVAVVFDTAEPMGDSTCVACGECVQACPTGALLPKAVVDELGARSQAPESAVASVCPYCGVGCQVEFRVRDDAIVEVTGRDGPSNLGRLCVKGRFGFDYVRHPERLTVPLVRRDGAAKDPADCVDLGRARARFREATWEEAMARAAQGLAVIRDSRGPNALAGFGSAKGSNEEAYLFQKLVRTGFGTNNVDHCTRLCHAASVAALLEGIGSGAVTAPFTAAMDSEVIVVIGARPTENHPVAATFLKEAATRGAKLVVMDPRGTGLDRFAAEAVRFAPGRDVPMLNALLHVIIAEELYDRQYVAGPHRGFRAAARPCRRADARRLMGALCGVSRRAAPPRRAALRAAPHGADPLGHGHQPVDARHRQHALPHRAGAALRQVGRPGRGCTRCAARTTCRAPPTPG